MKRILTFSLSVLLFLLLAALGSRQIAQPALAASSAPAVPAALELCGAEIYLPLVMNHVGGNASPAVATSGVTPATYADVNGDGCADLIVGVPFEDIGGFSNNGSAQVIYGGVEGITATANWSFFQDTPNIPGIAADDDNFGASLALGDFDGDGYADLAVGIPQKTMDGEAQAGAVAVLYGSSEGLNAQASQLWYQGTAGVTLANEAGDQFGWSLAAADFDGDGHDELAVGIPGEDVGNLADAGTVYVLTGSESGLTATGAQTWNQADSNLIDNAEPGDLFGWSLTTGNFNGDEREDLAIGIPGEEGNSGTDYGYVSILYGGKDGLGTEDNQLWGQDGLGLPVSAEDGDQFGAVLDSGDIDADGNDDLVIGVPWEDTGAATDGGVAHVLYGSASGLTTTGAQTWSIGDVGQAAATSDFFSLALAVGDFDGDGYADVAFGVPGRDLQAVNNAGIVMVVRGAADGLGDGTQVLQQPGTPTSGAFGQALQAADFNGDGQVDLAVGAPRRNIAGNVQAGAVDVFYGSGTGLNVLTAETWHQDSAGLAGIAEPEDYFGWALP